MSVSAVAQPGASLQQAPELEQDRVPSELWNHWIPRFSGYVLFLSVWQLASGRILPAYLLPSPVIIVRKMGEIATSGLLAVHFGASLQKIAIGFGITYVLGVAIGILMARRWWDGFFRGYIMSTLTTPGLVFALVVAMIFGFSPLGPIVATVLAALPFVVVNVAEGARARPKDLADMARAFGMPSSRVLRHITLPFLAPYLFTALRYGFSIAWKIVTLTEVFGSSTGIGFMMRREFQSFSMAGMLGWIFYFFVFALFLEVLLQRGMKRFFRWRAEAEVF
jgi:NitT/TauT family transport system permease protein